MDVALVVALWVDFGAVVGVVAVVGCCSWNDGVDGVAVGNTK